MGRRKLYGAALAAHQRKLARRGGSTALVRRGSTAVARRTRVRYVKVRRRRRRGGFLGGGGGSGFMATVKHEIPFGLGAAGYGYITQADTTQAVSIRRATLDKIPEGLTNALGKPLAHFAVGTFIATQLPPGFFRRAIGLMSHAAWMRAGHNFGAAAGDTDAFKQMSGDDDDDEFSGAMDADYEDADDEVSGDDDDSDDVAGDDGGGGL